MAGIEIAGIALASAGAAQQLFDCGQRIYKRIKNERQLNLLLREIQMFEVDDNRRMHSNYIQAVQPVLRSQLVDPADKERILRRWKQIQNHLIRIDDLIDVMIENSSVLDFRARQKARNELRDMGGTRILTGLFAEFRDDAALLQKMLSDDQPTFLSGRDFTYIDTPDNGAYGEGLFLRKGRLTRATDGSQTKWFLVESKPIKEEDDKALAKEDVEILAGRLARAQTDRGIFQLLGFREEFHPSYRGFELVFNGGFDCNKLPPRLSAYMQTHPTKPSLNFRVNLCCQLAIAVLETQSLNLVHKNIRPDNILVMEAASSPLATTDELIPAINLSGWQYARHTEEGYVTRLRNEVSLQRKVYQHPERQLPTSDHDYSMAHDVYSLGVSMLEILRWKSVLVPGKHAGESESVSEDFIAAFRALKFSPNEADARDRYTKFPRQNKAVLLRLNDICVPVEAGTKMSNTIHGFLTCLDEKKHARATSDEAEGDKYLGEYSSDASTKRQEQATRFMDTALKDLLTVLRSL
ncbi:uncharacterized protein LY79DRAFT_568385 [Colletotrichum navitas]|uniref:Protein kinase domain-containing protein n=1 Tax=Colletotrichum navitas TaxID=681940 RepID=A0AAD8PPY9_9PEZI|nr:uncharacterized protein LY79DRAFT_568385 [Colletotrichum navitas]KAK1573548.1 hypothetical protein LY79DRAFT_568385 [Colletotrichum navitas]